MSKEIDFDEWEKWSELETSLCNRLQDMLFTMQGDERFTFSIEDQKCGDEYATEAGEGFSFMYTRSGQTIAKAAIRRVEKIAAKYFPKNYNYKISSHLYQEL